MNEFSSEYFQKKIELIKEKAEQFNKELVEIDQLSFSRSESVRKPIKDFRKISKIIDSINFEEMLLQIKIERSIHQWFEKGADKWKEKEETTQ